MRSNLRAKLLTFVSQDALWMLPLSQPRVSAALPFLHVGGYAPLEVGKLLPDCYCVSFIVQGCGLFPRKLMA